jgi:endogenous inhibitor of DNA gyrase (YacG/DUF329 family)
MAMEESGPIGYRRCSTCGRWHPEAGSFAGRFCSRECAKSYGRCPVCGGYFERNDLTSDGFCSAECAGVDAKDRPEDILEMTAGEGGGGDSSERDPASQEDG